MTKEGCIINPVSGRAVKTTTALGKKLMKQQESSKTEPKPAPKPAPKTAPKPAPEKKPEPPKPAPKPAPEKKPEPAPVATGGVKRKYDADYIKGYAKHISNKYPEEGLKKALDKAKNGNDVKEIYADYTAGKNKSMINLGKIVDQELTKEEKLKLFKEDKLVSAMYYRSDNLYNIKQEYLFKFDEPAE